MERYVAHVVILVLDGPMPSNGTLEIGRAQRCCADPPRRLGGAYPAITGFALGYPFNPCDLAYQRLPFGWHPVRRYVKGMHGTRFDTSVALVMLHVALRSGAILRQACTGFE
ncbi:MAG TPA: hypothetical protein VMT20_04025 [Terriglobia bacterium]|nr:hypothetical protein [Terriglobia bacterium]